MIKTSFSGSKLSPDRWYIITPPVEGAIEDFTAFHHAGFDVDWFILSNGDPGPSYNDTSVRVSTHFAPCTPTSWLCMGKFLREERWLYLSTKQPLSILEVLEAVKLRSDGVMLSKELITHSLKLGAKDNS